jgi:hypothetical protein
MTLNENKNPSCPCTLFSSCPHESAHKQNLSAFRRKVKIFSPQVKSKQTSCRDCLFTARAAMVLSALIWVTTQGASVSSDGFKLSIVSSPMSEATQSESHCFPIEGPFECI